MPSVSFPKIPDGSLAATFDHVGSQHFVYQPRAVFGAGGRKVAPGLAPADETVFVLNADENRGSARHPAKGRDDGVASG